MMIRQKRGLMRDEKRLVMKGEFHVIESSMGRIDGSNQQLLSG